MWVRSFNKNYRDIDEQTIWKTWVDVNNWPKWDSELDFCDMKCNFDEGTTFMLKPKQGPKVSLHISGVLPNRKFTSYCRFPGAVMYNFHEITREMGEINITNTITVKGPLAFLWSNLVAKKVAKAVPKQTDNLVEYARRYHG